MFSKEEAKRIRKEFWTAFGKMSKARKKRQWLLYNTKTKDVSLKFFADRNICGVAIDIELKNSMKRHMFFESFTSLQNVFDKEFTDGLIWDKDFLLDSEKTISRIHYDLNDVSIYKKEDWPKMFKFIFKNMKKLESLYIEYEEIIEEFTT